MKTIPGSFSGRKLTGKFRFKATGESAYVAISNVIMHKRDAKITKTAFKVARKGYVETIDEEVGELEDRYSVKCNDFQDDALQRLLFATRGADTTQAATEGVAGTLTD